MSTGTDNNPSALERNSGNAECRQGDGYVIHIASFLLFVSSPAAVFFFIHASGDFYSPMIAGALFGGTLCSMLLLCSNILKRNSVFTWNIVCWLMAAFAGAAFLSIVNSSFPPAVLRSAFIVAAYALTFYFLFNYLYESGRPETPLWIVPAAAMIYSAIAIAQYFGVDPLPFKSQYSASLYRAFHAYSVFGNADLLADYLAISVPVSIGVFLMANKPAAKVFYALCSITSIICIFITSSRGAAIGASAGVAILLIGLLAARARGKAAAALAVAVLLACSILVIAKTQNIGFKQNSVRLRAMTWHISLMMIEKNPVTGVGAGRYGFAFLPYQAEYFKKPSNIKDAPLANLEKQRHAHNEFLQVAAETGLIGLAVFVLLIAAVAARLFRRNKSFGGGPAAITSGLTGSLASFCVVSLFSFPMRIPPTAVLLIFLLSVAAAMHASPDEKAPRFEFPSSRFLSPFRVRIEAVLLVILFAFLSFLDLSVEPLLSNLLTTQGLAAVAANQYQYADSQCGKALSAYRLNGDTAYCLGLSALNSGHADDAVYFFTRALNTIDDPLLHYNLGAAQLKMNNFTEAEKQFSIMRGMAPSYIGKTLDIADLYASIDRGDDSEKYYRRAISELRLHAAEYPSDADIRLGLAKAYYSIGDIDNYRKTLVEAARLRPDDQRIKDALKAFGADNSKQK